MAHLARKSIDGPRDGQSFVAVALRRRFGCHAERLRQNGLPAHSSTTSRLAGQPLHRARLRHQANAPHDHAEPVYQRASVYADPHNSGIDADNRFLWRANRQRLEAEALWDTIHATAGTLNLKIGGRPAVPPLADDELSALRERWQWTVSADPAGHTRRGLYILVRRNFRFPMFEVFDSPINSVSSPQRDATVVAPQALWSLNNHRAWAQAQQFAARLVRDAGADPAACVDRAWLIALRAIPPKRSEHKPCN